MRDFLRDQTSSELSGWLACERIEDEIWTKRIEGIAYAIARAFGSGQARQRQVDEDEEVIDTTAPGFAEKFQGFIGAPGQRR